MNHRDITNKRQFKSATGYTRKEFEKLLEDFQAAYFAEKGETYEEYIKNNLITIKPKFTTLEDILFFMLFQLKNDMLLDSLACVFGLSNATAHIYFSKFSDLLAITLEKKRVMPDRKYNSVEEFEEATKDADILLIDGTENPTERPKDTDSQKGKYSGKKKTHTDIALVISDKKRYIYYISPLYDGSNVDYTLLKMVFPPKLNWFANKEIAVDLGFVGIDKDYNILKLHIGIKKPRKSKKNPSPELSQEAKTHNKAVNKLRIPVEHAIGGIKICRILKNRCRTKIVEMKDKILGICAGLWNYKIKLSGC